MVAMEWCATALCANSQKCGFAPVFSSEVHRNGLDGLSTMSSLRLGTVYSKCGRSVVHNLSGGKWGSGLVPAMPIFKMNAAVGDSSSLFPVRRAPRVTKPQKIIPQEKALVLREECLMSLQRIALKDGPLQWLRNAVASRTAQKEEMINNLKRYGFAGVLSYGLLNTGYYLSTFLFVWFYVAPSPGGLGFGAAAQRFLKVFATVWAGSQVTKLFRAAGALSLAPFVDRGLNWYTQRFNFNSRATAFSFLVGACFGLAVLVFLVITTLWS